MLKRFLKILLIGYPINLLIGYLFENEWQWLKTLIFTIILGAILAYINRPDEKSSH